MKLINKTLTTLLLAISLCLPAAALSTVPAYAACTDAKSCAQEGVCAVDQAGCQTDAGSSVNDIISTVINILSLIVGVAAVIMIIVGGFKYVISSGDSANIQSAKNTILYAIVGLVIVALAQVIVRFVINKAT